MSTPFTLPAWMSPTQPFPSLPRAGLLPAGWPGSPGLGGEAQTRGAARTGQTHIGARSAQGVCPSRCVSAGSRQLITRMSSVTVSVLDRDRGPPQCCSPLTCGAVLPWRTPDSTETERPRHRESTLWSRLRALSACRPAAHCPGRTQGASRLALLPQVALVQWTESVGLTLVSRDLTSMQLRTPGGQVLTYSLLQTFPFTSESKRMGVVVRVRAARRPQAAASGDPPPCGPRGAAGHRASCPGPSPLTETLQACYSCSKDEV